DRDDVDAAAGHVHGSDARHVRHQAWCQGVFVTDRDDRSVGHRPAEAVVEDQGLAVARVVVVPRIIGGAQVDHLGIAVEEDAVVPVVYDRRVPHLEADAHGRGPVDAFVVVVADRGAVELQAGVDGGEAVHYHPEVVVVHVGAGAGQDGPGHGQVDAGEGVLANSRVLCGQLGPGEEAEAAMVAPAYERAVLVDVAVAHHDSGNSAQGNTGQVVVDQ